jgi:hypothetical protein
MVQRMVEKWPRRSTAARHKFILGGVLPLVDTTPRAGAAGRQGEAHASGGHCASSEDLLLVATNCPDVAVDSREVAG